MSEKLEKCPFCGGEVDFWTRTEAEDYQALIIDCKDCPANMEEWVYKYDKNFVENFEKKKAEMFEAWNRRIERTAKATRKPEAFFYRCECGYGLCCEKNDMNYCPSCGCRLIWGDDNE